MVDLKSLPPDLQQRYGYKPHARWLLIAVLVVAVVLAVGIGWLAWVLANPPVTYKLLTWDAADDHMRVTWEVHKRPEDTASCVLRATDIKHHDVGYAVVSLPAGADYEQPTYLLATRAPGTAVELLGCAANRVPAVPAPEFPPGTSNPVQPWTPTT